MINSFFRNVLALDSVKCDIGLVEDGRIITPDSFSSVAGEGHLHISLKYSVGVTEEIYITRKDWDSCTAMRRLTNVSGRTLKLNELFFNFSGVTFGGEFLH